MQNFSQKVGILAEQLAQKYLRDKDYQILAVNYKKPWGEIDIVAQKDGVFIFTEVKANSRLTQDFQPEERVNKDKFSHIVRTANAFLNERASLDKPWQIDIISVNFDLRGKTAQIRHFKKVLPD